MKHARSIFKTRMSMLVSFYTSICAWSFPRLQCSVKKLKGKGKAVLLLKALANIPRDCLGRRQFGDEEGKRIDCALM